MQPLKKLDYKYFGPFVVLKPIGKQAYQLDLSKIFQRVHNVFHVSFFKPYGTFLEQEEAKPPPIEVEGKEY